MDVKGSEWNYETKLLTMWVGYMWKNPWCLVLPWLQNHIVLALNRLLLHIYVSNSKLDRYPVLLISE